MHKKPGTIFFQPIIIISIAVIVAAIALIIFSYQKSREPIFISTGDNVFSVSINGTSLFLEKAITSDEQAKGLSGRTSLPPDGGMFFPFDPPKRAGFWMKDMVIPLDFIYVYKGDVVEVKEDVQPALVPLPFFPETNVDAVIEVNAGWVKTHNIKVGDKVGYQI